jgi:Flp pilus assembly protein TadD
VPWVLAHRDLGIALERLGRTDEAARYYARFTELWTEADPALQPLLSHARERLALLVNR